MVGYRHFVTLDTAFFFYSEQCAPPLGLLCTIMLIAK